MSESTQDDRLLSLEESVRDLAATNERMVVSHEVLTEKVTGWFDSMAKAHGDFESRQSQLEKRIEPFETKAKKSAARWDFAKKAALPALGATAGVFGTKFGHEIVSFLSKLFNW